MSEQANGLNDVKTCIKCHETKPLDGFSFDRRTGKYVNTCKACKVLIAKQNGYQKKGVTFCPFTKKRGLPYQKKGVTFYSVKFKQHYKHY